MNLLQRKTQALLQRREQQEQATTPTSSQAGSLQRKGYDAQREALRPPPIDVSDGATSGEAVEVAKDGVSGSGEGLHDRGKFESMLGADFADVRVHQGDQAQQASQAIGADAYALGNDIALQPGADDATVAHELTHVAQQSNAGGEAAMAKGGGKALSGGDAEKQADSVEQAVRSGSPVDPLGGTMTGGISAGVQRKVTASSSPRLQRRPTEEEKAREKTQQDAVVEGMAEANDNPAVGYYNAYSEDKEKEGGALNKKYWKKLVNDGNKGWYHFQLLPGVSGSEAIDSVFAGPTTLECLSMNKAVLIRSVKEALGKARFDKFCADLESQGTPMEIATTQRGPLDKLLTAELVKPENVKTGDWVYFHNHPKYLIKHPAGYWQGENAIYNGDGTWSGFGASNKTSEEMHEELLDAYNGPRTSLDTKKVDEIKENIRTQGAEKGWGEDAINKMVKAYDEHYSVFPESVGITEIPGIDSDGGTVKELQKETDKVNLREAENLALVKQLAKKYGRTTAEIEQIIRNWAEGERKRLDKAIADTEAKKSGKCHVTRVDMQKIHAMAKKYAE